jgi:PIN domain nuclease of toxin-antitoxin system
MNFAAVADTHAALWYVFADSRLSSSARSFIDRTIANGATIAVSSISLVEIAYLVEKKRIPATAFHDLRIVLADPGHVFKEAAVTSEIAEAMLQVPRDQVPDMPDRIVAATAIYLGVPALSRDGRIRTSLTQTIW